MEDLSETTFGEAIQLQQAQGTPLFSGKSKRKDEPIGKWEIDFTDIKDTYAMNLLGYGYNRKRAVWEKIEGAVQQINKKGHNYIMTTLESIANKATPLTKLTYNQAMDEILDIMIIFDFNLFRNYRDYQIPNWSTYRLIIGQLRKLVVMIIMMNVDGWTAENRNKSIQVSELLTTRGETERKKGVGAFKLW